MKVSTHEIHSVAVLLRRNPTPTQAQIAADLGFSPNKVAACMEALTTGAVLDRVEETVTRELAAEWVTTLQTTLSQIGKRVRAPKKYQVGNNQLSKFGDLLLRGIPVIMGLKEKGGAGQQAVVFKTATAAPAPKPPDPGGDGPQKAKLVVVG